MICFNCKRQIPDGISNCPNCGAPTAGPVQVVREVKARRTQRWFFYFVFIVVFLAMLGYIIYISSVNAKVVNDITAAASQYNQLKATYDATKNDLDTASSTLKEKELEFAQKSADSQKQLEELNAKTTEFKTKIDEQTKSLEKYSNFSTNLGAYNAGLFKLLIDLGKGMSNRDLIRIPVADYNFAGTDTDSDGLPDVLEQSFGSDKNATSTGKNGYTDKKEVLGGWDPTKKNVRYPIDVNFANANKGRILIQTESKKEIWYVNPVDGKRYFMGLPNEALTAMKNIGL